MTDTEQLSALHTAVASYLSTLLAISECLGAACPEVGGPFRQRLSRLRSRLAFDTTPEAMTETAVVVERELGDFAEKTSRFVAQHGIEMRRTIEALESIVKSLAHRQEFYVERLRRFASQMEAAPNSTDPGHLADAAALQAAGLLSCVESMGCDAQSLVARMYAELAAVSVRLRDAEVTDRLTGLMNRPEMERQIERRRAAGGNPVLLVFELTGEVRDEVAQQVATRLDSQFHDQDLICRWSEQEFLVLFQGTPEMAQARTEQIVPSLAGRYLLDNGESAEIHVEAGLVAPHLAMQ